MLKKVWTWSCNSKIFYNKIDAVKHSVANREPIYYHAPDSYDNFPWFTEPKDTWDHVLKQRALEIRNSSKKINIMFSGGCDSTKMLETFVKNNIYVDSITCLKYGVPQADYEVTEVAEPYLKKIKHLIPNTKININSLTVEDYKNYYNDPYWSEKETMGNAVRFRMTHAHMENSVLHKSTSDVTHLLGRDKPSIVYNNGHWYCYFLDVDIETNTVLNNANCVFFYADDTTIHAKQCHMLMNYFKNNFDPQMYESPAKIRDIDQKHINTGAGRINSVADFFIRKITDQSTVFDKQGNSVLVEGSKDATAVGYMIKEQETEHLVRNWQQGLDNIKNDLGSQWLKQNQALYGTVGVFSKFYCLTKPEVTTVDNLYPNGWK